MPKPKKGKINAKVKGAKRQAGNARAAARMVNRSQEESARNVATDAELILQEHAPRRSHRLARGIRAVTVGDQVILTAKAVDPDSGFDYVAVSRFGHRKKIIKPVRSGGRSRRARNRTRLASGRFGTRRPAALRFYSLGQLWILPSVRGFKPTSDWVQDSMPEINAAARDEMEQTGNKIAARWSS